MSQTESFSKYEDLEKKSTLDLLNIMNEEDKKVPIIISKSLKSINTLIEEVYKRMKKGGRLFYIGSGTPGRLGIVDASECPPTFGVSNNVIIGIIAGGDNAIRNSIEGAEDNLKQGWQDLKSYNISYLDSVLGVTSSGRTPYVVGALEKCKKNNIYTGLLTSNNDTIAEKYAVSIIRTLLGPEVVTGSTRMKSGTAQKLILNMISTASMIKLGYVKGNKMIDMQTKNSKLRMRAIKIIQNELLIDEKKSKDLLEKYKSVRLAIENGKKNK
mgnify:CR=1 FL=1